MEPSERAEARAAPEDGPPDLAAAAEALVTGVFSLGLSGLGWLQRTAVKAAKSAKVVGDTLLEKGEEYLQGSTASQGLREEERCSFWLRVTQDARGVHVDPDFEACRASSVPPETAEQIEKDLDRTRFDFDVPEGFRAHLESVLVAVANYNPEISYVQGMNYIAGFLLCAGLDSREAFVVLCRLLGVRKYNMASLFKAEMPQIQFLTERFNSLLDTNLPAIKLHLDHLHYADLSALFLQHWIMLFSQTEILTRAERLHLWDLYLVKGWPVVIKMSFAILDGYQSQILAVSSGEELEDFFTSLLSTIPGTRRPPRPDGDLVESIGRFSGNYLMDGFMDRLGDVLEPFSQ